MRRDFNELCQLERYADNAALAGRRSTTATANTRLMSRIALRSAGTCRTDTAPRIALRPTVTKARDSGASTGVALQSNVTGAGARVTLIASGTTDEHGGGA